MAQYYCRIIPGGNCCALRQLECTNNISKNEISSTIDTYIESYLDNSNHPYDITYLADSIYCIAKSDEKRLENNLKTLGFIKIHEFNRRTIYDQSIKLRMYIRKFIIE